MAVRANCPRDQSIRDISIESSIGLGISHLFEYIIGPLFIAVKIAFKKIREEKDPENGKHDEELHKDDPP